MDFLVGTMVGSVIVYSIAHADLRESKRNLIENVTIGIMIGACFAMSANILEKISTKNNIKDNI